MEPTHPICTELREEFLLEPLQGASFEEHASDCASCAVWLARTSRVTGLLGSMDRLLSPLELEERVAEDLELGSGALTGALRGLPRLAAPAELEQRVAKGCAPDSDEENFTPAWAPLLAALERHRAPLVLDRLLDEELWDSEAAITRRQAGGLFRLRTPQTLFGRVAGDLTRSEQKQSVRNWLPLGSLAAAALLIWAAAPSFVEGGKTPEARFRVVQAQSLASLDPLARSLVEGLSGGRVQAVQNVKDTEGIQDGGGQR